MKHLAHLTMVLVLFGLCFFALARDPDLMTQLTFEEIQGNNPLKGWGGSSDGTVHFERAVVYSGSGAARLERNAQSPDTFTTITKELPIDFGGDTIELRGFLRTQGVEDFAGLWLRQDGPSGSVEFDNMQSQNLRGTIDWAEYRVRLPLNTKAEVLYFGVLVVGEGTVWADDLQLLVDGKPLSEAPERVVETTVLDTDRAFDEGSGITATSLSETQIENLAVLGKVWGFLKYHHPRVAGGDLHWDYELFRVLPGVLDVESSEARNRVLSRWLDRLGVPTGCDPCAAPPENVHLLPNLAWLSDTEQLGSTLSRQLQDIYQYRFTGNEQFYATLTPGVGNPVFEQELAYSGQVPPDPGFRLLALLRYWNIIAYWFPYKNQIDSDWDAVLREFLPRFAGADTWDAYRLELLALITRVQDTHANLWSELEVRPPRGDCFWPFALRFIEGQATVTAFTEGVERPPGLELGDVVEQINGQTVEALVEAWRPLYSASNETTRLRDIARALPRGTCGESVLIIRRSGETQTVAVTRQADIDPTPPPHDRPGETFQMLSPEVAYLKLSSIRAQDAARYIAQAADTEGLIIDIRNYPSEFVVFALGSHLVQETTPFARFTTGDLHNPGAFAWTEPVTLQPAESTYQGSVVILVDESSISQAEYTAMAFRAAPGAVVVGSTTAGADGNVSTIPLPGGIQTLISGIGVFYPDKTPTQQIGIVPDIVAEPTVEGTRTRRDEVLEEALRYILGPEADEETIRELAQ